VDRRETLLIEVEGEEVREGGETRMPGVFADGDVRLNPVKRVAAAVRDGSTAIRHVLECRTRRGRASTSV
jgi:thioredoxin reductase